MLLFGPYLVETVIWVLISTVLSAWVTRFYIHSIFALSFGKIRKAGADKVTAAQRGKLPFVTVLLPVYNEEDVIDRLLNAVTAIDYPNYEVIALDDASTDSTPKLLRRWQAKGKIKVVHRDKRVGFKAGALNNAMKHLNPRSKYLLIFDADYVPQPGIIWQMLKDFSANDVAAVQGYTKHTLNASQNFVTKDTRIAFSLYSLVDVAARQRLNGFIPLFGSGFMIDKQVLIKVGGFNETSITEDWELATRLAENGYRVVFDEGISVPAECPSTFAALVKQQMRWSEGIVRDTRRNFLRMLLSKKVNLLKKFDYLFYGFSSFNSIMGMMFYVLQVIAFLIEVRIITILGVDKTLLVFLGPYGQFLLYVSPLYIPFAFVFASIVSLYREDKLSDLPWCLNLLVVNTLLAPFISIAFFRGMLLEQGSWSRTPKTGKMSTAR